MKGTHEPLAYDVQQAADASSLSVRKLYDAIRRGHLRSYQQGRRRVVLRSDLLQYLTREHRPEASKAGGRGAAAGSSTGK